MKKLLAGLAVVAAIVSTMPAHAGTRTLSKGSVTLKAVTPCAELCSYEAPNANDPQSYVDYQTGAAGADQKQRGLGCTAPAPAGSFADAILTAPKGANFLSIVGRPQVDWDIMVCTKPKSGNNGALVGFETQQGYLITTNPDAICPTACIDTIKVPVTGGRKYVLRGFSYEDTNPLPVTYSFMKI